MDSHRTVLLGRGELVVANRVERLRKVDRHGHSAEGWSGLIKAHDHLVCEWKKGGGGGAGGTEAVLCGGEGE